MKKTLAILLLLSLAVGCGKSEPAAQQPKREAEQVEKQPNEESEAANKVHMPEANQYEAIKVLLKVKAKIFSYETLEGDVVELALDAANVSDNELSCLTRLRELESLNLIHTNLNDTGLRHLKGLVKLKSLNLRDTQITDAGLVYLEPLTSLKRLNLSGNKVTDAGVAELQMALPDCKISH